MHIARWAAAALLAGGATCGSAQASVLTFISSSAFAAAITGMTTSVEDYSTGTNGQLVPNNSTFNNITYAYSGATITGGIITDIANSFSGLTLGGLQTTGEQYFFGGDQVTVTLAAPVHAIGVFFNVNPNSGTFGLNAGGGSVATDSTAFDTSTFVFDGIVSDTPFTTATFFSTDTGLGSYNIPEIETATAAAVPEPASLALVGTMLVGLGFLRRRNT